MSAQRSEAQMKIYVRNNDVDKALRILKKKLHNEGVMKEVRDRRHFTPPGEEKRLAKKAGRKRWLKKRQQLEQQFVREERNQLRKNRKNKLNTETEHVHLAIKVSDYFVKNFVFTLGEFITLIGQEEVTANGWTFRVLSDHVKIYKVDYTSHLRIPLDDWHTVRFDFATKLKAHQDARNEESSE